jgi:hypothetical protein
MKYRDLKRQEPVLVDCFFAFSREQLSEGVKKHNLEGKTLVNAGAGLIGTKEGIEIFFNFYEERRVKIKQECTPQEVYDYEFWNHECTYTHSDNEVIEIVESIFGKESLADLERFPSHLMQED